LRVRFAREGAAADLAAADDGLKKEAFAARKCWPRRGIL
jgi:hypothetical protein